MQHLITLLRGTRLVSLAAAVFLILLLWALIGPAPTPTTAAPGRPPTTCVPVEIVASPNAPGGNNSLAAVAATSPSDVWAVGSVTTGTVASGLILRWNGTVWSIVPTPPTPPLRAVAVVSATDAWAVGGDTVLHWDGSAWRTVTPAVPENDLIGVAAISTSDVWVITQYKGYHWDGSTWTERFSACCGDFGGHAGGISAVAANDIWVAGDLVWGDELGRPAYYPGLWRWDGAYWSAVPHPIRNFVGEARLLAVDARTANDAWASGCFAEYGSGCDSPLIAHWNGVEWSEVATPPASGIRQYKSIAAVSATEAWAVGTANTSHRVIRWDGTSWQQVALPTIGAGRLDGVTATSDGLIWAVGDKPGNSRAETLILRFGSACQPPHPTTTPTPIPTATPRCYTTRRFADSCPIDWYYTSVEELAAVGAISGYSCGGPFEPCYPYSNPPYFRPYAGVTRAQFTKILLLALDIPISEGAQAFTEVPPGHPFYGYINTAARRSLVGGYSCGSPGEPCNSERLPYFRPYAPTTRAQVSKVVVLARDWSLLTPDSPTFADVLPTNQFYRYIETAAARGILAGYICGTIPSEPCDGQNRPYFRPYISVVRAQAAKMINLARPIPPSPTATATLTAIPTATPYMSNTPTAPPGIGTPTATVTATSAMGSTATTTTTATSGISVTATPSSTATTMVIDLP